MFVFARTFVCHVHKQKPSNLPLLGYDLPLITFAEGLFYLDGSNEENIDVDHVNNTISWFRVLPHHGWFEYGLLRLFDHLLSGDGVIVLSQDAKAIPDLENSLTPMLSFRVLKKTNPRNFSKISQDEAMSVPLVTDKFRAVFDLDVWKKGDKPPVNPKNSACLGIISFETHETDDTEGLSVPIITIDILDQLRDAINSVSNLPDDEQIESLYTSTVSLGDAPGHTSSENSPAQVLTFTGAALVAELADQPISSTLTNLTFKDSLQSSIVLPILFQELQVSTENTTQLEGALFEYDPMMRGCLGNRHFLALNGDSALSIDDKTPHIKGVFQQRNHLISKTTAGSKYISNTKLLLVRNMLEPYIPLSLQDLVSLQGYNETAVHQASQSLIQKTMLYHMNDDYRTKILQQPDKPDNLPPDLTDKLSSRIVDWIQQEYSLAYLSNLIVNTPPDQKTWKTDFSQEEIQKIRYWFSGQGDPEHQGVPTLAKSQDYLDLTKITARLAMRDLYPRVKDYQDDDSEKWARCLLANLQDVTYLRAMMRFPIVKSTNYANKACNILNFLDSDNLHGITLSHSMFGHVVFETLQLPYIDFSIGSVDDSTAWIIETFEVVGVIAFGGTTPNINIVIGNELLQSLKGNLEFVESNLKGDPNADPLQRVQFILNRFPGLPAGLSKALSSVSGAGGENIRVGTEKETGLTMFKWLSQMISAVSQKLFPDDSINLPALKGILSTGLAAFYIAQSIYGFLNWDKKDSIQRATLIETTLRSVTNTISKYMGVWTAYNKVQASRAQTLAAAQKLDETLAEEATSLAENLDETLTAEDHPNAFNEAISNRILDGETPTPIKPEAEPSFAEPFSADIDVQEGLQTVSKTFNAALNFFNAASVFLSIGLVINSSLSLSKNWNSLNAVGRGLNIAQISISGLAILASDAIRAALVATDLEFFAEDSALIVGMPPVGIALAIVGVIFTVVMFFVTTTRPTDPPPSPVDEFIKTTGQSTITNWPSPPHISLSYDLPTQVTKGDKVAYSITGKNISTSPVFLYKIIVTFESGNLATSLFQEKTFTLTKASDPKKNEDGYIYLGSQSPGRALLTSSPRGSTAQSFDVTVTGPVNTSPNPQGSLRIDPNRSIQLNVTGSISQSPPVTIQISEELNTPFGRDVNFQTVSVIKI